MALKVNLIMLQLFSILFALVIGYFTKAIPISIHWQNKMLSMMVIFILFIMGYELGSATENLSAEFIQLGKIVGVFVVLLLLANFLSLVVIAKIVFKNKYITDKAHHKLPNSIFSYIVSSLKYIIYVALGIIIGHFLMVRIVFLNYLISGILLVLLFLIGHQMRQQGVSLRQIILNKVGASIAVGIFVSSLVAGIIASKILQLDVNTALVLSSGFGWYSMSGILTSQLINQQIGTAAFFIDFIRELLALILIPTIGSIAPLALIGYCGGTAMDFTLPIIKQSFGEKFVPIAISSGMFLSILTVIAIPLLWSIKF